MRPWVTLPETHFPEFVIKKGDSSFGATKIFHSLPGSCHHPATHSLSTFTVKFSTINNPGFSVSYSIIYQQGPGLCGKEFLELAPLVRSRAVGSFQFLRPQSRPPGPGRGLRCNTRIFLGSFNIRAVKNKVSFFLQPVLPFNCSGREQRVLPVDVCVCTNDLRFGL